MQSHRKRILFLVSVVAAAGALAFVLSSRSLPVADGAAGEPVGHYQIVTVGDGFVVRLNTRTGDMNVFKFVSRTDGSERSLNLMQWGRLENYFDRFDHADKQDASARR